MFQMGLERVGLLGFCWLTASLTLCVASVFAPGSLFYLVNGELSDTSANNTDLSPLAPTYNESSELSHASTSSWAITSATGEPQREVSSYASVAMLLCGIIISRFGELDLVCNLLFVI